MEKTMTRGMRRRLIGHEAAEDLGGPEEVQCKKLKVLNSQVFDRR